jgi:phage gp45-like
VLISGTTVICIAEGAKVVLEENVFMNNYCSINAIDKIEIGKTHCLVKA